MKRILALIIFSLFMFTAFAQSNNIFNCYAEEERQIPIIMYHSVLPSKTGQYCVTPSMLEDDLKYLKERGYQSVFISDIIDFCEGNGSLPEKPVVISFDDGHYNNYYYAYPVIAKMNFKANLNVIGCFVDYSTKSKDNDNPSYSYLTWSEIKTLQDSGYFEIGNHTYKMHNFKPRFGICKKKDESKKDYQKNIREDILKLENKLKNECNITTKVFAYPFGEYNDDCENILRGLGYKAFLTCNEGINKIKKGESKKLSHLKRINRTGLITTAEFFEKFDIK